MKKSIKPRKIKFMIRNSYSTKVYFIACSMEVAVISFLRTQYKAATLDRYIDISLMDSRNGENIYKAGWDLVFRKDKHYEVPLYASRYDKGRHYEEIN